MSPPFTPSRPTDFFAAKKNPVSLRCVRIRKQRRKKAAFARLRRQNVGAALLPATSTKGAVSNAKWRWMRRFSLHPHQNRPFYGASQFCPRILDGESAKSGPSSLGGLGGRSKCFLRQKSTAERNFPQESFTSRREVAFSYPATPCCFRGSFSL